MLWLLNLFSKVNFFGCICTFLLKCNEWQKHSNVINYSILKKLLTTYKYTWITKCHQVLCFKAWFTFSFLFFYSYRLYTEGEVPPWSFSQNVQVRPKQNGHHHHHRLSWWHRSEDPACSHWLHFRSHLWAGHSARRVQPGDHPRCHGSNYCRGGSVAGQGARHGSLQGTSNGSSHPETDPNARHDREVKSRADLPGVSAFTGDTQGSRTGHSSPQGGTAQSGLLLMVIKPKRDLHWWRLGCNLCIKVMCKRLNRNMTRINCFYFYLFWLQCLHRSIHILSFDIFRCNLKIKPDEGEKLR